MTIWVLTENDFQERSEVLVTAWTYKPSQEQLSRFIDDLDMIDHVLDGGGPLTGYDFWYTLHEIEDGQI